jgi:hypothetical protein
MQWSLNGLHLPELFVPGHFVGLGLRLKSEIRTRTLVSKWSPSTRAFRTRPFRRTRTQCSSYYNLHLILAVSGLRDRRRKYYTILKLADHALFKMVRYVLLRPLRPERDGRPSSANFSYSCTKLVTPIYLLH